MSHQTTVRSEKRPRAIRPAAPRKEDFTVTPLPASERAHREGLQRKEEVGYVIRAKDGPALKLAVEMTEQIYRSAVRKAKAVFSVEEVLKAMGAPSDAEVVQLRRNAEARAQFLSDFTTLTSKEVAELAGSRARNQAALANRWKGEGRIFAVEAGGQTLFPAFQFSEEDSQPRPAIAEILKALGAAKGSGWQTALWFAGRNGWLGEKRPVDLLATDPGAVVEAALRESEAFD